MFISNDTSSYNCSSHTIILLELNPCGGKADAQHNEVSPDMLLEQTFSADVKEGSSFASSIHEANCYIIPGSVDINAASYQHNECPTVSNASWF